MKFYYSLVIGLFFCVLHLPAGAEPFDGSKPFLCASVEILECAEGEGCVEVTAKSINAPRFLKIDTKNKKISGTQATGIQRTSKIDNVKHLDGKLILQGVGDGKAGERGGLGWTLSITQDTGNMVLTASGGDAGFVIFGGCTLN